MHYSAHHYPSLHFISLLCTALHCTELFWTTIYTIKGLLPRPEPVQRLVGTFQTPIVYSLSADQGGIICGLLCNNQSSLEARILKLWQIIKTYQSVNGSLTALLHIGEFLTLCQLLILQPLPNKQSIFCHSWQRLRKKVTRRECRGERGNRSTNTECRAEQQIRISAISWRRPLV